MKAIIHTPETKRTEDGRVIRVRTDEDYDRLWKKFCDDYSIEFTSYMGYGIPEIEELGIRKFIDFNDWYYDSDIGSYKTDVNKVVICAECGEEFALFPNEYGLCQNCQKLFDMDALAKYITNLPIGEAIDFSILFGFDEEVRDTFRKSEAKPSENRKRRSPKTGKGENHSA